MKRSNGNDHADVMRQQKYPMPGTDLGETTAIPYNEASDVDAPGTYPSERESVCACGHVGRHFSGECRGHHATKTFVVEAKREELEMPSNPTRARGRS